MTRIALVRFDSGRHDEPAFARDRSRFLAALGRQFEVMPVRPGEEPGDGLQVAFIASGGCEQAFRRQYRRLRKPVVLLADDRHNSLPAALEISAWVRRQGEQAEIVHGSAAQIAARLRQLERFQRARRALAGRIGVIGRPSDWLIASRVDRAAVGRRWGTKLVDIGLEELSPRRNAGAAAMAREIIGRAEKLDGVDEKAVLDASRLIPALRGIFRRHRLAAATLRCFDLIAALGSSGCLALSRLNDEGLICGCEGDVPAAFTMLLAQALTGVPPFLANPSAVDTVRNEVVLAHCTVPTRAVGSFRLQTHFESGRGIALSGEFPRGTATLLKVGGPALDRYFVSGAEVLPHRPRPGLCRTQVRLRLERPVSYFLRAALANHHVLVQGDHAREIDDFMNLHGAERIE